jgi:hypothetical protein
MGNGRTKKMNKHAKKILLNELMTNFYCLYSSENWGSDERTKEGCEQKSENLERIFRHSIDIIDNMENGELEGVAIHHYKSDPVFGEIYLLSVRRKDGSDDITWSELQEFKNKVCGENSQALEVYPKECEVVNHSKIRHLWIISPDYKIPFTT